MRNHVTRRWGFITRFLVLTVALGAVHLPADSAGAAALEPEQIMAGYRQVLSILATGAADSALEALYELETTHMGELPTPRLQENYWRLKLRVIRGLLDSGSSDLLIPIIVLHHDAYLMYRDRRQPILAAHTRTMTKELAEILGEQGGTRESQIFAGWVLTSLGSYLQEYRSVSTSAVFFHRALDFDPGNQAALMGLAVDHEKVGDYSGAIPYLERVLSFDRHNHQARLRLALCQARSDETLVETAKRNLSGIVQFDEVELWIRSVAYQELARIYLAEGQKEEASSLLREALESLHGDQHLAVQLAAILDEDRRRKEALAVLDTIRLGDWEHRSCRLLYDSWPTEGIPEARDTMRAMRDSQRPNLAKALQFAQAEIVSK